MYKKIKRERERRNHYFIHFSFYSSFYSSSYSSFYSSLKKYLFIFLASFSLLFFYFSTLCLLHLHNREICGDFCGKEGWGMNVPRIHHMHTYYIYTWRNKYLLRCWECSVLRLTGFFLDGFSSPDRFVNFVNVKKLLYPNCPLSFPSPSPLLPLFNHRNRVHILDKAATKPLLASMKASQ